MSTNPRRTTFTGRQKLAVCWVVLAWTTSLHAAADTPITSPRIAAARADSADLEFLARSLPIGAALQLEGLLLDGLESLGKEGRTLRLERFRAFTADARIVIHGAQGDTVLPAPRNAYFRGRISGEPGSVAWLTALEKGGLRGMVAHRGSYWVMATEPGKYSAPGLTVRRVDPSELAEKVAGFSCANDELPKVPEPGAPKQIVPPPADEDPEDLGLSPDWMGAGLPEAEERSSGKAGAVPSFTARLALETDWEYFQKFGNATDAADYAGDLVAYSSGMFRTEIDTSLEISSLSLWSTGTDPWDQPPGFCGLLEFGRHWNDNKAAEVRTLAHFLSGKSSNVGIAWLGVLCAPSFTYNQQESCPGLGEPVDDYGGAYGFSSGIDGNFDADNPGLVWDVLVVAHEIGHNFNSPHSHCYQGLGGSSEPVDSCYSGECGGGGCYCGETGLPCGQKGAGCGTVMSYCHFLSGGIGNISFNFGTGHPYGVAPARIAERMYDHVVARAAAVPGCLHPIAGNGGGAIFLDGFESGDLSSW